MSDPPPPPEEEEEPEELFGGDDAEAEEPDVEALFGSSEEEPGEAELFGASDEEAPSGPAARAASARSEVSAMDERDIFGDVSDDDEPEKELTVDLEERLMPQRDQELVTMRLANIMSFEETEYNGIDSITDEMQEGYKEYKNIRGNNVLKLVNPENCVRWRFEEDEYGNRVLDAGGKHVYESNTRLVEWEDGSWSLYVGKEPFSLEQIDDRTPIFEENSKDVYVCHGNIKRKFIAKPKSMDSTSHEMLKKSQYRKYEPVRRSLLMTESDTTDAKQALEIQLQDKKKKKRPAIEAGHAITAGFLEDDASVDGPSVADIKKQYRPAKRPKNESPVP